MSVFIKIIIFNLFLISHFSKITFAQAIPDMSNLDSQTRSSIRLACAYERTLGPTKYANCIRDQLRSIGINPR